MTSNALRLVREVLHHTPDSRRYYPDRGITAQNMINWDGAGIGPTEEIVLEDADFDLGIKVLSIRGIAGIVVWPHCLQARVEDPATWSTVEPQLATALADHTNSTGYEIIESPQQVTLKP